MQSECCWQLLLQYGVVVHETDPLLCTIVSVSVHPNAQRDDHTDDDIALFYHPIKAVENTVLNVAFTQPLKAAFEVF